MHAQVLSSGRGSEATEYSIRLNEDLIRRDASPSEEVALNWIFHRCMCAQFGTCVIARRNAHLDVKGARSPGLLRAELKCRCLTLHVKPHSCCREAGSCSYWHEQNERYNARPYANFCYMRGSMCNDAGAAGHQTSMRTKPSSCMDMSFTCQAR
jgi:hypothetical protein